MNLEQAYHYTDSGLDDIWLVNGFQVKETPYGQGIAIEDIDGLHTAIGIRLATGSRRLTGKEIRFLRHEMDLSQHALGQLLGVDAQAVARWEKNQPGNPPAERLIRALYLESVGKTSNVSDLMERLAATDTNLDSESMHLELSDHEWQPIAA